MGDASVAPQTKRAWERTGLSASEIARFIGSGLSAEAAREWVDTGLAVDDAIELIEKQVAPAEAAEFDRRGIAPHQLTRTPDGLEMDLYPWQEDPLDQLPSVVEAGSIRMTLWTTALGGDPVAHDISFTWDGNRAAEWHEDISMENDDLSFASSSPVRGVAGWPDGLNVELSYTWSDLGFEGYDCLPGVAPTSDHPESNADARDPRQWIRLGQALLNFVLLDLGSGGADRQREYIEYVDTAEDSVLDIHDMFGRFLTMTGELTDRPDFGEWLEEVIRSGAFEELRDE